METPKPASRYIMQQNNSKKRAFKDDDVEVLEIPPPPPSTTSTNRRQRNSTNRPIPSKLNKVMHHEIIDLDMEEDDAMISNAKVDQSGKGKGALADLSACLSKLADDGSSSGVQMYKNGTKGIFNSSLYYGEHAWMNSYYDDIMFSDDDYATILQSQLLSGIEAPFPWLPDNPQDNKKVPGTSTSTKSTSQLQPDHINIGPSMKIYDLTTPSMDPKIDSKTSKEHMVGLAPSKLNSGKEPLHPLGRTRTRSRGFDVLSSQDSANNKSGGFFMEGSGSGQVGQGNVDKTVKTMVDFKQFDTVEDYSDHHYSKKGSKKQPPKNWAKRIQEEWKILEKDLPDTIFVRVYESRMDLLRAVMVGAEGTPYHDGLFFFDVFFPGTYPSNPPQVHYHSGGLRINPNLYNCGKVCLSLLNTWTGVEQEKWVPGVSTMLQVLVSIQGLILNAKPYFNEPGYANSSGSAAGETRSFEYNERTFLHSLRTMTYTINNPPKYFEGFVKDHFCKFARDILVSCKAYINGAQVGCLVKGGVQDVDEGDKSCSKLFKADLASFITILVNAFSKIGAKDCEEFLSLSLKAN